MRQYLVLMFCLLAISTQAHSVGFAIYTTDPTLLSQYKQIYQVANSSSLLIDDTWQSASKVYLNYYNQPQSFPRMIIADNQPGIQYEIGIAQRYNFTSKDYVAYDAEDWIQTPIWEQYGQVYWANAICNEIHASGYKCAYTPEIYGNTGANLAQVNFSKIDLLVLQEQQNTFNQLSLISNVTRWATIARSENPNIQIYVQLDMKYGTGVIGADINILSRIAGVSGIDLTYLPSQCQCSVAQLDSLVVTTLQTNPLSILPLFNGTTTTSTTVGATSSSTTTVPIPQLQLTIMSDSRSNQNILITGCTPQSTVNLYYSYDPQIVQNLLFSYSCPSNQTIVDYRSLQYWTGSSTTPRYFIASSADQTSVIIEVSQWNS